MMGTMIGFNERIRITLVAPIIRLWLVTEISKSLLLICNLILHKNTKPFPKMIFTQK